MRVFRDVVRPDHIFDVWVEIDEPYTMCISRGSLIRRGDEVGYIYNVSTDQDFRRRGYATAVMQELLTIAREVRISTVELRATKDGYPLYLSLGFVVVSSPLPPTWKTEEVPMQLNLTTCRRFAMSKRG